MLLNTALLLVSMRKLEECCHFQSTVGIIISACARPRACACVCLERSEGQPGAYGGYKTTPLPVAFSIHPFTSSGLECHLLHSPGHGGTRGSL